ncbi:hypothetical protein LCGC14_1678130 [marine sediment metagenome]|uniref:Uncharacterized protein n=1 Tax=marine sediment metagenome TaxID=412755 RepID=A0A0F9KPD1_9ZZZZ
MTDFIITPPSQEDVDTHASLAPFQLTPSGRYKTTLGTATKEENDSQTWVAVGLPITIISTEDGKETVNEISVAGRSENQNASTELFKRTQEEGEWIGTVGDDGEIIRRTDDGAQTAYRMSYKLLVQLFQAVGALQPGDTDLATLGFQTDIGLLNADTIVEALSGYEGTEVGAQLRNKVQKRKDYSKDPTGKKKFTVFDDAGKPRREVELTDFFTLS